MWAHAKTMTEAIPMHSSLSVFSWNSAHPTKIWQVPIELWREKTQVHAQCRLSSLTPASWSRGRKAAISRESACGA